MGSVAIIVAIVAVWAGYKFYAGGIDRSVVKADPNKATPAKMYNDGVDFMPASSSVLFGYQFKSIAALGPIVGPIVAVQWGWCRPSSGWSWAYSSSAGCRTTRRPSWRCGTTA